MILEVPEGGGRAPCAPPLPTPHSVVIFKNILPIKVTVAVKFIENFNNAEIQKS